MPFVAVRLGHDHRRAELNALITCCGRKIYLIDAIRRVLQEIAPLEDVRVLVTESYPYSPSLFKADKGFVVDRIRHPAYFETICKICRDENVSILLPTKDTELTIFAENLALLHPTKIPIASLSTVATCANKLAFYHFLNEHFRMPTTWAMEEFQPHCLDAPVVVKERGDRQETSGFSLCTDYEQVKAAVRKYDAPIVQQWIEGQEYTVDCLFDACSNPVVVIPRKRLLMREYVSDVGLVVRNDHIIEQTTVLGSLLKLVGPANVQWIERTDESLFLLEVNPRISGGLQISLAACPDFLRALVVLALGRTAPPLPFDEGVLVMKYDEVVSCRVPDDVSHMAILRP